ncbi:MAG: thiol oxidoreductase [Deltaproteobacteria bacterium]|nr:thiol oxidoreductase [Deltaproteobacteria bacterium]
MTTSGRIFLIACLLALLAFAALACEPATGEHQPTDDGAYGDDSLVVDDGQPMAGGDATVFDRSASAFSHPAPNLTDESLALHERGRQLFNQVFSADSDAVFCGLGPMFNNTACVNCHAHNGRGMPTFDEDEGHSQALMKVAVPEDFGGVPDKPGGPLPVPGIGTQIQDHAIDGFVPDAKLTLAYHSRQVVYADGSTVELMRPDVTITPIAIDEFPEETMTSYRQGPPMHGLGLLEAIPTETIIAWSDPDDVDGDGISGKVNYQFSLDGEDLLIGRFGHKNSNPTLFQQTANAYAFDIGIGNQFFLDPMGNNDEIGEEEIELVAFFLATIGVPARTNLDDPKVIRGEDLFDDIGCVKCHISTVTTGEHPIAELSHQKIHPYTDLLLHDMGEGLANTKREFNAGGAEWRTPPLWGIGVTHTVLPDSGFLHDGRARTIEEAIMWHKGEALHSRELFRNMPKEDRDALLAFLNSL